MCTNALDVASFGARSIPKLFNTFVVPSLDPNDHKIKYELGRCLVEAAKELECSIMHIETVRDYLRKLMEAQKLFKRAAEVDPSLFQVDAFTSMSRRVEEEVAAGRAAFEQMVQNGETEAFRVKAKDVLRG